MNILDWKSTADSGRRTKKRAPSDGSLNNRDYGILAEESFIRTLCLERKRTERSGKQFVLMLLDARKLFQSDEKRGKVMQKIVSALASSMRETDMGGWYKGGSVLGVIFTEIGAGVANSTSDVILARVSTALRSKLDFEHVNKIHLSVHLFPGSGDEQDPAGLIGPKLYADISRQAHSKRFSHLIKRIIDIAGSVLALIVFLPLFIVISVAIKLSSKGPILFRQERVGQYGAKFTFLKFRSMQVVNDPTIHKEYVRQFISGGTGAKESMGRRNGIYKLTDDPRVTRVGRCLRRTSLDELPQFFNVLKGDMSLVGPRPPIPYELESYEVWHRRRVREAKPGITGLWQVNGRSKTGFDDMVRLDLRYARAWSLWLDLKILLQTPRAVLSAEGAY